METKAKTKEPTTPALPHKVGVPLPFEWQDGRYGRAFFYVCATFKRGRMTHLYLDPRQQPRYGHKEWFDVDFTTEDYKNCKLKELRFAGYRMPSLEDPSILEGGYCMAHKCLSLRVLVPRESSSLTVVTHFGTNVTVEFR